MVQKGFQPGLAILQVRLELGHQFLADLGRVLAAGRALLPVAGGGDLRFVLLHVPFHHGDVGLDLAHLEADPVPFVVRRLQVLLDLVDWSRFRGWFCQ